MIESLTQSDIDALRSAVKWLEVPSFAARLTSMLGRPIDLIGKGLPPGASPAIAKATAKSLQIAAKIALSRTRKRGRASSGREVVGRGGRTESDKPADTGYFAIRGLLATSVTEAARFITERGLVDEGAPVLVRLIAQISARFGCVVTQKAAAQAIPIIRALAGAAVN